MAYDREYLNLEYLFTIDGTDEVAATGLKVTGSSVVWSAQGALAAMTTPQGAELIDAYFDIFDTAGVRWASYSHLVGIKASAKDTAGHDTVAPRVFTPGSTIAGNQDGVLPQSTVVASLRSGTAFGKANYGRSFLPHTLMPLADVSPYASTARAAVASLGIQQWITRVNASFAAFTFPAKVAIMSNADVGPGTTKTVTRVAVDTLNDTQRRRRNRLNGDYEFNTIP